MQGYYYYYYEKASEIPDVREAFERVCVRKILQDGYFDMSQYIHGGLTKGSTYRALVKVKSPYAPLYHDRNSFPNPNNIVEQWCSVLQCASVNCPIMAYEDMSEIEAKAIVHWVYAAFKSKERKEKFTKDVFSGIKDLASIHNTIRFKKSIVYNFKSGCAHF